MHLKAEVAAPPKWISLSEFQNKHTKIQNICIVLKVVTVNGQQHSIQLVSLFIEISSGRYITDPI